MKPPKSPAEDLSNTKRSRTFNYRKGIGHHGLLCTSILLLGKGAIENMNGLVRQYIPKRTNFRGISRGYVRRIVEKLNNRPRKKNGFSKPAGMINDTIA